MLPFWEVVFEVFLPPKKQQDEGGTPSLKIMSLSPNQFSSIARTLWRFFPGSFVSEKIYSLFLREMHQVGSVQRISESTNLKQDELIDFLAQAEEHTVVMAKHKPRGKSGYQPNDGDKVLVYDARLAVNDLLTPLAITMQPAVVVIHYLERGTGRHFADVRFDHDKFLSKGHFVEIMYAT